MRRTHDLQVGTFPTYGRWAEWNGKYRDNNDGANDNNSWNCGVEGPTEDAGVNALRLRQIKNALAMLLVCQGVPMLRMGDECGQTQLGNDNAYCHDSALTWLDWGLIKKNAELFRLERYASVVGR